MKKVLFYIFTFIIISSCSSTKEATSSKNDVGNEKIIAEQEMIRKAVESRRFIARLNRIYFSGGGMVDLVPRSNYIIVDGNLSIIKAAYLGRQYDIRPIAGITMKGETINYELKSDSKKRKLEIKMKVQNRSDSFEVYLTIGNDGSCNASVSSIKIDQVRYSGHIIPIRDQKIKLNEDNELI
jgi:hypothetical protein